jgi:RNA-binding protein
MIESENKKFSQALNKGGGLLREAGIVRNITNRFVVVRANAQSLPKVGSQVLNKRMENVGFIYDVIGPVKSPFLLIKPEKGVKLNIAEKLFVKGDDNGRSRKGKGSGKERSRKRGRKKGN